MPRNDWRLCMGCTDPMECGSWATCFAPAHERRWVVYDGMKACAPAPEPIGGSLPCNWSVWRIPNGLR